MIYISGEEPVQERKGERDSICIRVCMCPSVCVVIYSNRREREREKECLGVRIISRIDTKPTVCVIV